MFALVTLMGLINQVSGTPYIPGGDSPAGTDCSGLASWVANTATGRPTFGDRFHTGNEEAALLARGFKYGTAPNALVIGWNGGHTAVTLPDGTPVASGERGGGVRVGGGGAFQPQFTHHMYLPMDVAAPDAPIDPNAPLDPNAPVDPNAPAIVNVADIAPPPPADPAMPLPLDAPPMGDQAAAVAADLATMPAPPPPPADGELPPPPDGPVILQADNVEVPPPAPAPGDAPASTPI